MSEVVLFRHPSKLEQFGRFLPILLEPFEVKGRGGWGKLTYHTGNYLVGGQVMGNTIDGIQVFDPNDNALTRLEGTDLATFRDVLEWACDQLEGNWAWYKEPTIYQNGDHTISLKYRNGSNSAQFVWKILPAYDKEQIAVFAHNANLAIQALAPNRG